MSYGVNLNPPISVLAFGPLSRFDPFLAYRVWYVVSFAIYVATLVRLGGNVLNRPL